MVHSMTGFASESGAAGGVSWTLEMRGVNAKGLDIRVRAPERMVGFDQKLKAQFQKNLSRGNINVTLRYEVDGAAGSLQINEAVLDSYLSAAKTVKDRAKAAGVNMDSPNAADILALRGVLATGDETEALPPEADALKTADKALKAFLAMRAAEGAALKSVLETSLDDVSRLVTDAAALAEARKDQVADALRTNLTRVLANSDGADADRVAQELAMLAVKADVTEEIDRLKAHVDAARDLLATKGAIGRKLDFLMQEFNREANTLCSKSGSTDLTRVGLDLKALIDQMREQVQNVE
ncbi:YicC/YloC family endoribonuclease [uncultured Litoreibacter sp.]|uniref:YicC/YloC family endoribonuclease n=1 Tax=uncultured Litoreibacter sp. TaxID=1392394 RepID=UPI00262B8363|nr:YicC/YloC family endoribonuclease [uncultured Litoreibacter sp.]